MGSLVTCIIVCLVRSRPVVVMLFLLCAEGDGAFTGYLDLH